MCPGRSIRGGEYSVWSGQIVLAVLDMFDPCSLPRIVLAGCAMEPQNSTKVTVGSSDDKKVEKIGKFAEAAN